MGKSLDIDIGGVNGEVKKGAYPEDSDLIDSCFLRNANFARLPIDPSRLEEDPFRSFEEMWGWCKAGNHRPRPIFNKADRYIRVASEPNPKKMNRQKPDATCIQRSKTTWPPAGNF